jgi:hypothetical protein
MFICEVWDDMEGLFATRRILNDGASEVED